MQENVSESLLYTTFYQHNKDRTHRYRSWHTLHTLFTTHLEISMNNMLLMAILHCRYYLDRKQAQLYEWHLKETEVLIKKSTFITEVDMYLST